MDWMERMNEALAYLEEHLEGEIDFREVARIARCSPYHFQRVFSYMAGTTLAEYIRRRRLTLAAFALQQGGQKVIDVALRYGYESPTAFTRAFTALHGMTPSEAQRGGHSFTAYPPISFQISIKGVTAMNYRIEEKDAFRVVGAKLTTTMLGKEGFKKIPAFWQETFQSGKAKQIAALINQEPYGMLGLSAGDWHSEETFDYYIAAATDKPVPEGLVEYTIPAGTWAIFEAKGPNPATIQGLQQRVVTEWLPTSGYEYGDGPDIEIYIEDDQQSADCLSYVWLPIKKKQG